MTIPQGRAGGLPNHASSHPRRTPSAAPISSTGAEAAHLGRPWEPLNRHCDAPGLAAPTSETALDNHAYDAPTPPYSQRAAEAYLPLVARVSRLAGCTALPAGRFTRANSRARDGWSFREAAGECPCKPSPADVAVFRDPCTFSNTTASIATSAAWPNRNSRGRVGFRGATHQHGSVAARRDGARCGIRLRLEVDHALVTHNLSYRQGLSHKGQSIEAACSDRRPHGFPRTA